LQELEQRLRLCERQGIEAASEIQTAARRVAEENKKLRRLLHQHGVDDDRIGAYLQSAPAESVPMPGIGAAKSTITNVQSLEQLLGPRRAWSLDTAAASTTASLATFSATQMSDRSRETSVTSATTFDSSTSRPSLIAKTQAPPHSYTHSMGLSLGDAAFAFQDINTVRPTAASHGSRHGSASDLNTQLMIDYDVMDTSPSARIYSHQKDQPPQPMSSRAAMQNQTATAAVHSDAVAPHENFEEDPFLFLQKGVSSP
jgi:hypothetical protein